MKYPITVSITVEKDGKTSTDTFYLEDKDDVKNDFDCKVVRDLLDVTGNDDEL
jgi:hypothetical protein